MKKKASINLSINMIIVMIIGIVVLGLALGFIRGMFGSLTQNIDELAANEPEPDAPSFSEPITLSSEHKIMESTDTQVVKAKVYNPTDTPVVNKVINVTCNTITFASIQVNPKDIPSSQTVEYLLILETDRAPAGTYLCEADITMGASPGVKYSKDFDIEIRG
ncbi:MAG: hypothetical protein ABIE94_00385 [archaeon]